MSFTKHMKGYMDLRTLYQTESLLAWKRGEYFPPVMAELNPTNKCNQRCRYCYTNRRISCDEMLRDDVLIDVFSQLADAQVRAVLIQGTGEPLMHKALPEAIANGSRRNISIGLTTNGILLNKSVQERILEHLLFIRMSVLEINPRRYAYLHGCPEEQWKLLIDNLRNVVTLRDKLNLQLGLYATIYLYEENYREAYAIAKYFKDLGIDYLLIQEPTYTAFSPAGRKEYASKGIPDGEIEEVKSALLTLHDEDCYVRVRFPIEKDETYCQGIDKNSWIDDYCQGVKFVPMISCDGGVYPCWRAWGDDRFCYGSLYEYSFEEIWQSGRRRAVEELLLRTPPEGDECRVCNIQKLNEILDKYKNATSRYKDFLL